MIDKVKNTEVAALRVGTTDPRLTCLSNTLPLPPAMVRAPPCMWGNCIVQHDTRVSGTNMVFLTSLLVERKLTEAGE